MEIYMYYFTVAVFVIQVWCVTSSVNTEDLRMDLQTTGDVVSDLLNRMEELVSLESERKAEMNTLRAVIRHQEMRISELEHAQKDRNGLKDNEVNTLLENEDRKDSRIAKLERTFNDATKLRYTKGGTTYRKPNLVLESHKGRKIRHRRQDVVDDVAFYAVVDSHHLTNLGAKQRIEFDRVVTNIGNAYRPDIGAFISPVSGTYVFSATLMGLSHHNAHYYISHNGQAVANMFIHGQDSYLSSSSRTVVLYLNKGDEVSVRNMNVTEGVFGFQFSSFSGFLKGRKIRHRRQDVVDDVAFYAVVDSHHLTNLGAKQRIEFDRVVTNIGNAYRPDIGAFISPVSGTYVFSATLMGLSHHNAHYYISHNGQAVANMFIHGQDSYLSSSSRTVVLYLNKGDEVSVRNMNVTEGVFGFQFSSFSGFLKGTETPAKAIIG